MTRATPDRPVAGKLRILATTDIHAAILPYDFYIDRPTRGTGLLNLQATITAERDTGATTLLVDNGDFLQGTPMADVIATDPNWRETQINPIVETMNAIGYDAVGLGNHEFNFGLNVLAEIEQQLDCPVLCATVLRTEDNSPLVAPWVILDRTVDLSNGDQAPIRIGIISVVPPQVKTWDALIFGDTLTAADIIDTAKAHVPAMKAAGADVIIALCHAGIGAAQHTPCMENAAIPLAAIDGIDALVLGHTHETFPVARNPATDEVDYARGLIHGKPAVMPRVDAASLGVIDMDLHREGDAWRIHSTAAKLVEAPEVSTEADLSNLPTVQAAAEATFTYIRTPIGETDRPITSYFALVANCDSVQIIADAQREIIDLARQGTQWADYPLLSAAAPFKSGGRAGNARYIDIPRGPLVMCNAAEIYLYPNNICAALMTGADIAVFLERSAGLFHQVTPQGGRQAIINLDFPSYNFDVMYGLTYQIDLTQPARFNTLGQEVAPPAQRIHDLRYNGAPVSPDAQFVVATNSYRIGGGGYFFADKPPEIVVETRRPTRNAVVDFFQTHKNIGLKTEYVWQFRPIDGVTAMFEAGENAPLHTADVHDRKITGFERANDGQLWGLLDLA